MNRADRMLAVLMDGRPKTRQEIQWRAGYFLTNNAASELRKRGLVVNHWREGRVDYYQLCTPLPQPGGADNRDVPPRREVLVTGPSSGYESGDRLVDVGDLAVTGSACRRESAGVPSFATPSFPCVDQSSSAIQLCLDAA